VNIRTTSSRARCLTRSPWPIWAAGRLAACGSRIKAWTSTPRQTAPSGVLFANSSGWTRSTRKNQRPAGSLRAPLPYPHQYRGRGDHFHVRSLLAVGACHRTDHADHRHPACQVVLAGGTASCQSKRISVEARRGDTRFGICSTTFGGRISHRLTSHRHHVNDETAGPMSRGTDLAVRGRRPPFDHPIPIR